MTSLFSTILDMSITASYVALAVIAIRIFLKKMPKIFSYMLWLPVFVRLVLPFSFNSKLSFFSFLKPELQTGAGFVKYAQNNIGLIQNPIVNVRASEINKAAATTASSTATIESVNHLQSIVEIASSVWVLGVVALLIYSIFSYIKVINNVKTATLVEGNIFETDRIISPFVCGFIRPKIFLPTRMNENELSYILKHEQTHIKRLDYILKPFAFLALIIHWFNPLIWLSFALMSKDMEMSCDESVIKQMGNSIKGSYSNSLLSLSFKKSGLLTGSPLSFGESNIKSRIKNILNYKKPAFWVAAIIIAITSVLIVSFTSDPRVEQAAAKSSPNTHSNYDIEALLANKTSYVGNNSKVVALIDALPLPKGIVRSKVKLITDQEPYSIIINLTTEDYSDFILHKRTIRNSLCCNSILLFSLIDNVNVIEYLISDNKGNSSAFSTNIRDVIEGYMGGDVRTYADSKDGLVKLVNKIEAFDFSRIPENKLEDFNKKMSQIDQIENYLDTIMSSPKQSSNHFDYIKAHQKEYGSILGFGERAYTYLNGQLQKSNDKGLRYQIITQLCKDIKKNVPDESLSTEDLPK